MWLSEERGGGVGWGTGRNPEYLKAEQHHMSFTTLSDFSLCQLLLFSNCYVASDPFFTHAAFCSHFSTIPSSVHNARGLAHQRVLPWVGRRWVSLWSELRSRLLSGCGGFWPARRASVPVLRTGRQREVATGFLQPHLSVHWELHGF